MTMSSQETERAAQLIADIEHRVGEETLLLRERADKVTAYMGEVIAPNMHTLRHIASILNGDWDHIPLGLHKEGAGSFRESLS